MKKKLLALFMGMTLAMGTAACGSSSAPAATAPAESSETTGTSESEGQSTSDASTDQADASASSEESDNAEEAEKQVIFSENGPTFLSRTSYLYDRDESGKFDQPFGTGHIETLKLSDDSAEAYPEFAKAFSENMSAREANAQGQYDGYVKENKEYRATIDKPSEDDFIYETWVYEDQYLRRIDDKFVSLTSANSSFAGGAHGYTGYSSVTYDINTGKEVDLKDVIPDEEKLKTTLEEKLLEVYSLDEFLLLDKDESLSGTILPYIQATYEPDKVDPSDENARHPLNWSLDPDGVLIYFNAYDIAPFSTGCVMALIPYSSGLIADEYLPQDGNTYICKEPTERYILTDADGDDKTDVYNTFARHLNDDYTQNEYESLEISCGNNSTKIEEDFFNYDQYLLCKGDKRFLLLCCDSYNDYSLLYNVPLLPGSVGKYTALPCDTYSFAVYDQKEDAYYTKCLTHTSDMVFGTRLNLLSTYTGQKTYTLNDDGSVSTDDKYYRAAGNINLTSKADIKCDILDDNDNPSGEETLPSGTNFKIFQSDGESFVDCTIDDGRKVRLNIEEDKENYGHKINGVNENDLFEELYYAG